MKPFNLFKHLLVLGLMVFFGTLTVSAQEAYAVYDGFWKLTFYYDDQRIMREGTTYLLNTGQNTPGWYGNKAIQNVVFDPSFASARPTSTYSWFNGMKNLETITGIQYLNTSSVTDMVAMFMDCDHLTSLDLSHLNTANVTNMYGMFEGCSRLTDLDLSSFNTNKVTQMSNMFCNCSSLTNLDLSGFNTNRVTQMSNMFYNCSSLTNLDLSGLNTASVTTMRVMFYNCRSLTNLDLSGLNTANVTDMYGMFWNCTALTTLDLSGWNTENLKNMQYMFKNCSSLTTLDISSFNTRNALIMANLFENCFKLATIYVGEQWSTANVTVSDDMFNLCYDLVGGNGTTSTGASYDKTYAHIDVAGNPGFFTDIATDTSREAYAVLNSNNTKLTFYFDKQKSSRTGTVYNLNASGNTPSWYSKSNSITEVVFSPSFASARPTTTYLWFGNMTNLTTITGIEYLKTSRVTDMKYMFVNSNKLTSIDLSGFNASNVTNMYGMFDGCSSLTSLDARSLSSENVTNISHMFRDCSALTNLIVSSWSVINATDMSSMFEDCSNLTELNLNGWFTRKVINMQDMFSGCSKLTTISVGEGWSTASVTASDNMFRQCNNLIGGNGTAYDVNHIDKTYAHVDIDGSPGYLTSYLSDGAEPYAVLSPDKTTLTFYYDNQIQYRQGTRYAIEPDLVPGWIVNQESITTVEFHELFANYHGLTSTKNMFAGLENLTQINHLEHLNTEIVTNMSKMFSGCLKLTSVNVFYFDTGNVTDMSGMFEYCHSLTSLFVANFNTSKVLNMEGMFQGCRNLHTLDLSNFDTTKVKNMKQMFTNCISLTSITNMNFNTAAVENMSAMFAGCSKLTSLSVSSFNTQNVTNMHAMFKDCSSLTTLNIGNIYTSNVTTMERMFDGCSALTSLTLSARFNTSNVTNMAFMFQNCSSLESLDLSRFNTENVYNMQGMFDGCGCATLDVTGFNTSKVITTESMFANIAATTLNLINFDMSKVVNFSKMFAEASNLTTIYCEDTWECNHADSVFVGCTSLEGAINYNPAKISGDYANPVSGYFSSKSYAVLSEDGKTLTFYHDDKKQTRPGTKYILSSFPEWYDARASITTVVFDGDFYYARPTNTSRWFSGMTNLETITNLKYLNTSQVTDMSYMFYGCSKLTTLDLSRFNTEKVTTMASMFQLMSAITTLNLGSFKPQNVKNMGNMFYGDTNLKTIYVSSKNWTTASVTSSYSMFYNCPALTGGNGTSFNASNTDATYAIIDGTDGNPGYLTEKKDAYAVKSNDKKTLTFYYDYMMDSREGTVFEMPKSFLNAGWVGYSNRDITTIDFDESFADYDGLTSTLGMFGAMSGLKEINHLDRLNTENVTSMQFMFNECTALTTLDLSGFNTKKVTDMGYMFYKCPQLTTIYVGSGWDVSQVNNSAEMFALCTSLVGSNGTQYNESYTDKTYARIDGRNGQPGYLSAGVETYAVYTSGNSTLTFYHDSQRFTRSGNVYDLNKDGENPGWYGNRANITKVVFNLSFANALPTTTYHWFYGMTNLTTITSINYLNTSEVTNMNGMFYNCQKLTTLDLSSFNTENVTNMREMFAFCSGLTTLYVNSWNTANVNYMYQMFRDCSSLTSLDLTSFSITNLYDMTSMFDGCSALTTIYVGSSWGTPNDLQESSGMFDYCTSLVGGAGTEFNWDHTDFDYAHIDAADNPGYLTAAPYAIVSEDCTTLTFYNDGDFNGHNGIFSYLNKAGQMPGWFDYRSGITNVVFDESFASARPTTTYSWFYDMRNLTTFTGMENLNTSEVTSMALTFASCNSLTTLDLTNWNTTKVTNMYAMFNGSGNLTTIYVGSLWSTAKVTSSDYMFTFCTGLMGGSGTKFDFNNPEDKTYAHVDGGPDNPGYFDAMVEAYAVHNEANYTLTFYYDKQRTLHTEGAVHSLNTGTQSPGWYDRCRYVDYVVFDPSFADARPTTTYRWFCGMDYLKEIQGIEYLNTSEVTNMVYMFYNCSNSSFTTLDLSNFNTKKVTNMNSMFEKCTKLKTIYVSNRWSTANVTSSTDMFTSCSVLVGGNGTSYTSAHVDKEYARIDAAGTPGYFTYKASLLMGDVNSDGEVNVADITALTNYLLSGNAGAYNLEAADVDDSGSVTSADISALVQLVLGQ